MPVQTYRQGENWVEQPGDHHVLAENTSQTEPAKLLVVFIADTGDPSSRSMTPTRNRVTQRAQRRRAPLTAPAQHTPPATTTRLK